MTQTEMNTAIAAAVALALQAAKPARKAKAKKATTPRQKLTDEQKAANAVVNGQVAEKLFSEAGYTNCKAHETIRTYDKWIEVGRRVKKGEKALRTPKGMALFHLDQTSPLAPVN